MTTTEPAVSLSVDYTAREFLDAVAAKGGPPIYKLSVQEARAILSGLQAASVAKPAVDIEDREIPGGPKGKVSIRIVRPQGRAAALPIVMFFHGGGWVLGGKDTHDRLISEIAVGAEAAVVFVDYSRSPEAKFPVPVEECYAATKYCAQNAASLSLDAERFAVFGDSAGGQIAAAVTMLARERGGPRIDYQVLLYPVTDTNFDTRSYKDFAEGYWLTREAMKWFWDNYLTDRTDRDQPLVSPLQTPIDQLAGLPPALVVTGEFDVLRDEGEEYAHRLNEARVNVTAVRCLGAIHDFAMLNALANTPPTRCAIALANGMLQKAFERKQS